jgi:hypothetical protein
VIDHSQCDHPSTSSARAKCRRARAGGDTKAPREKASKKEVWFGLAHHNPDRERNRGTTPRDRDRQCAVCGVEKIQFRGTDQVSGILLFVGERCLWRIKNSPDLRMIEV